MTATVVMTSAALIKKKHSMGQVGTLVSLSSMTNRCVQLRRLELLLNGRQNVANAKSSMAVLHNRNDMTNLFRASNWVSESKDSIVSRGVATSVLA